jgi:hypothetical protein
MLALERFWQQRLGIKFAPREIDSKIETDRRERILRDRSFRIPEVRRAKDSLRVPLRAHIRTASPCTGDRIQLDEAP